jgi:hypothetical protein
VFTACALHPGSLHFRYSVFQGQRFRRGTDAVLGSSLPYWLSMRVFTWRKGGIKRKPDEVVYVLRVISADIQRHKTLEKVT